MLGSHLVFDPKGGAGDRRASSPRTSGVRGLDYDERVLWQTPSSMLTCSSYESYPTYSMENDQFSILLEGSLYNFDGLGLESHLSSLAEILFGSGKEFRRDLREWLLRCDGDFLVFVLHKQTGDVAVLNDLFGRLPAFYSIDNGCLTLSRDVRSAIGPQGSGRFDRMAMAQVLLLGIALGKRTFYEGVRQLEPATLIKTCSGRASIDIVRVHEFNLEQEEHASKSLAENARNLAILFREACGRRSRSGMANIVSLSGGLDSRAVAAGLCNEKIPFAAASFLDERQSNGADFETAEAIAASLGTEWFGTHLSPPEGADVVELLDIKDGCNSLRMSFILPFFRSITERFGPGITYFTGDGGGDVLGHSIPYRRIRDLGSLADYIIERYEVFSPKEVASLTGVPVEAIRTEILEQLGAYPEQRLDKKYQHFYCLSDAIKMYNEGEDRNRHYFWSVSPFYAPEVFAYGMNCLDGMKEECRLHREFLSLLHPAVANIRDVNWNAPLGSARFKLLYRVKNITRSKPEWIRRLRRITGRYDSFEKDSNVLQSLAEQRRKFDRVGGPLHPDAVRAIVDGASRYDRLPVWTLFTLTSLIDSRGDSEAVLSRYLEKEF